eukprot:2922288-Amphidinium_carterae.2
MNNRGNQVVRELRSEHQAVRDQLVGIQRQAHSDRLDFEEELRLRDEALASSGRALEQTAERQLTRSGGGGTEASPHTASPLPLPASMAQISSQEQFLERGSLNAGEPSFACLPTVREGTNEITQSVIASRVPCACAPPILSTRSGMHVPPPPGFELMGRQEGCEGSVTRAFRGSGPFVASVGAVPSSVPSHELPLGQNMFGRQHVNPQIISASASTGSGIGAFSWFQPSEPPIGSAAQVQIEAGTETSLEIRRDRSKIPEFEWVNSDAVTTLHTFETWLLRCSMAVSTWCKNPVEAVNLWEQILQEASRKWVVWSGSTPTERRLEALNRPLSSLGRPSVNVASTAFEAILRSDLLERVPKGVVDKILAEGRLSSVDVLEELMKLVLPAYHTVRVTLLDSVEGPANKCSSYVQLQASLRQWTRSIRIAMSRYGLSPEPRRLWLSVLNRVASLQSEPMFAAILDRHMVQSGVRTNQTLESVLSFTVAVEAEVDALVQDQVQNTNTRAGKNEPKAHAAGVSGGDRPSPALSKPGESGGSVNLCKAWNTQEGCKYGKACKFKHPHASIADGLCFVCGSTAHKSRLCPRSKPSESKSQKPNGSKPGPVPGSDKGGKSGGGRSQSGNRDGRANSAGSARKGSQGRTSGDKGGKSGSKPNTPRASNPARALSAAVDFSTSVEGLLDSGASHVIAPLEELTPEGRDGGQRVALTLASGKPTDSLILCGEVFAQKVRRVLVPFGKLVRQTGLLAVWSRAGLSLLASDRVGNLRLVYRPKMRQGGMPHIPDRVVDGFRSALKSTRENPRLLSFEEWQELLGEEIPVCDSVFSVCEDGLDVHGKKTAEETVDTDPHTHPDGNLAETESKLTDVLERFARSADRMTSSIESCMNKCASLVESGFKSSKSNCVVHECAAASGDTDLTQEKPLVLACASKAEHARVSIQERICEYLSKHGVPTTNSRTNVGTKVRSMLLGLYTRRGIGITNKTERFPILDVLHDLARTCSVPVDYVSIAVNVMTDTSVREHRDGNNMGPSFVYVCGDFSGGEFVQGGTCLPVKNGWFRFFGQIPHEVRHVKGTRISIVFFVPNGVHTIVPGLVDRLESCGFPAKRVLSEGVPQLLLQQQQALHAHAAEKERGEQEVFPDVAGKFVLIEYACFDDSLLSARFEMMGGVAFRLGLPSVDLSSAQGRRQFSETLKRVVKEASRVVVWFSVPCSSWSSIQQLNVHKFGEEWLRERQERAMPLIHAATQAVRETLKEGAGVVWEWPHRLSGWNLSPVQGILQSLPFCTRVDGCSYGFTYRGKPCKKPWLLRSSFALPGLERRCTCVEAHIACEGGSHVSGSSRYTEQMVVSAVRAMRESLAIDSPVACGSETDEEIGFNRDGMLDDLLSLDDIRRSTHADADEDVESVSDDDDGIEREMREIFGDDYEDDEDVEIDTKERDLPEPDAERIQIGVLNHEEQLRHEENGHYPKSPYCPICQMADGPTHQHRRLRRSEVGMLAVDLAGPLFPDMSGKKYIVVAVWVGYHNHKSVALPFVELVSRRLAREVFEALTRIVDQLENLVSPVLPSIEHGRPRLNNLRVLRLHTDRASEFLGSVARTWASENNVFATYTGSQSPQSNGRAECSIRVIKSSIRRSLIASGLSTDFWGFAARHSAELLRAFNLKRAGDNHVTQPLPFGSLVAIKRPGRPTAFKPFEHRGRLGRLLLHELGTRRCFIIDKEGKLWKGFAAHIVVDTCDDKEDVIPEEFVDSGWTRVRLVTGRHAWFNPTEGLFRLTSPPLLEEGELERVFEDELRGFLPREVGSDEASCNNVDVIVAGQSNSSSLDVSLVQEIPSPDLPDEHATSEVDTALGAETCAARSVEPLKQDEESYCCNCGMLVWQRCDAVVDYCQHYTCFDCRRAYMFEGNRVWACLHHPELEVVACSSSVKTKSKSRGVLNLCGAFASACDCKDEGRHIAKELRVVSFATPEVEQVVEFEVESISVSTSDNARAARCLRKRRREGRETAVQAGVAQTTAKALSRKRREAQALREMPSDAGLTLSKAVSISPEAVRSTVGEERELWKKALQSELTSLDDNRVFYKGLF